MHFRTQYTTNKSLFNETAKTQDSALSQSANEATGYWFQDKLKFFFSHISLNMSGKRFLCSCKTKPHLHVAPRETNISHIPVIHACRKQGIFCECTVNDKPCMCRHKTTGKFEDVGCHACSRATNEGSFNFKTSHKNPLFLYTNLAQAWDCIASYIS